MKVCLIDEKKNETFKEIELPNGIETPSMIQVEDCYKIDSEGVKVPIFIPRLNNEAAQKLCSHIFAKYKTND